MKIKSGKYTSEELIDIINDNSRESRFFSHFIKSKDIVEEELGVSFIQTSKNIKDYVIFKDENDNLWIKTIDNHIFMISEYQKTILLPITLLTNGRIIVVLSDIDNIKLTSLIDKAKGEHTPLIRNKELEEIILKRDNFVMDIPSKEILSLNEINNIFDCKY